MLTFMLYKLVRAQRIAVALEGNRPTNINCSYSLFDSNKCNFLLYKYNWPLSRCTYCNVPFRALLILFVSHRITCLPYKQLNIDITPSKFLAELTHAVSLKHAQSAYNVIVNWFVMWNQLWWIPKEEWRNCTFLIFLRSLCIYFY